MTNETVARVRRIAGIPGLVRRFADDYDLCKLHASDLTVILAERAQLIEVVSKLAKADCECDSSYNTHTCLSCKAREIFTSLDQEKASQPHNCTHGEE